MSHVPPYGIILIEPWMKAFPDKVTHMQTTGQAQEMRGHVYQVCANCLRVIKLTGWFGSVHLCE